MRLTEFGKAIGKGQGQEECVQAEADFASHCRVEARWIFISTVSYFDMLQPNNTLLACRRSYEA
jgi:hypothetical protein